MLVHLVVAQGFQLLVQDLRQRVGAFGDGFDAFGPVIDGVHAGHDGQQGLSGAYIGRGFLAADVLFAGLQGHAVGLFTMNIDRNADDAAGDLPLVLLAGGKEGGVRAAVAHRYAEALAVAHHCVGAPFARRRQQGQAEQVGAYRHVHFLSTGFFHQGAVILHGTLAVGVL